MVERKESQEIKNVLKKLFKIQQALKVGKDNNAMGRYNYRNQDDILKALKPLLEKTSCTVIVSDEIVHFNDEGEYKKVDTKLNALGKTIGQEKIESTQTRFYIKATATLYDMETGEYISSEANARESNSKKGMDEPQLTGSSSSYARKYALGGLFGLDDSKDPDNK